MIKKLATVLMTVVLMVVLSVSCLAEGFFTDDLSWNGEGMVIEEAIWNGEVDWTGESGGWDEGFDWMDEFEPEFEDDASVWDFDDPSDWVLATITVTIENDAKVRMFALSDSEIVSEIPAGKQIKVMGLYPSDDGELWAEIMYQKDGAFEIGYISIRDIKNSNKLPKLTGRVVVTADEVAIFDEASKDSAQIGVAHKGDTFDVWCYMFDTNSKPWASCFIAAKSEYVGCIPWTALAAG